MASKSDSDTILVATQSFVGALPDGDFTAHAGETRVRADHPAARKWPHLFTRVDQPVVIEQATAAPGEKRGA